MNIKTVDQLPNYGFEVVEEFEKQIAAFFGAPFAVATDSCTSGVELCLRLMNVDEIIVPRNTYVSIPMLAKKLGIKLKWYYEGWEWKGHYILASCYDVEEKFWYDIHDAAVLWKANSYIGGSMMVISCQKQKHLSVGRLGVILLDNEKKAKELKKLSYDGRISMIPWREQNISSFGIHAYCQPELAALALGKLPKAIESEPRKWSIKDWPDLVKSMDVFKEYR